MDENREISCINKRGGKKAVRKEEEVETSGLVRVKSAEHL